MGILSWIVVGLIAGWLAGRVVKGSNYGLIGDLIVGIVGALVGGFIAGQLFKVSDPISGINIETLLVAFLGAVLVIFALRAMSRNIRL